MRFLFPPHPQKGLKTTPQALHYYEKLWVAQRKFNGSHAIIWIHKDQVEIRNRLGEPFSNYRMTNGMRNCFLHCLNRDYDKEYVLDGEVLHTKAKLHHKQRQAAENTIVLFDVLYAGKYLTTLTTLERIALLTSIAPPEQPEPKKRAQLVCTEEESQIWLAETFTEEFSYRFWEFYEYDDNGNDLYPEIEGLILKKKDAKNTGLGTKPNEADWLIRCRKTKEKMYQL